MSCYFKLGEPIAHYAGEAGFGLNVTNRCNRLPASIKGHYLQKKKVEVNKRTKCARYIEPIIAVQKIEHYDIVLTSFQSTSSCNIMCVNAINGKRNFIEARTRGRGDRKRHYVI